MDFKPPKVMIGDVPIIQQAFSWSLTAGTRPFTKSFVLPASYDDRMEALQNPTTLTLEAHGGTEGKDDKKTIIFEQIYILRPKKISKYHTLWTLADKRFIFHGRKLYLSYNKTRIKNSTGQAVFVSDTKPASMRKLFDRFKEGRYLKWSVKDSGDPYSMLEILGNTLEEFDILFDYDEDESYILENVELEGVDFYSGIEYLLKKSRLQMGIDTEGYLDIYSLDFFDDTTLNNTVDQSRQFLLKPSRLYMQDLSRIKPRKIKIRFLKKQEVRVQETSALKGDWDYGNRKLPVVLDAPLITQDDLDFGRVIGSENIIQIPYPVEINGKHRAIGEWLPMWQYLQAINLSEDTIRGSWFGDKLVHEYAAQLAIEDGSAVTQDIVYIQHANLIVTAVKKHYRQTWKIDQWWMDRISSWEGLRIGVINNYDHFRLKSPVWSDHCVIPARYHPLVTKRKALWTEQYYNWLVKEKDRWRQCPTPKTLEIVSQALGIFRIVDPSFIDFQIAMLVPSGMDPTYGVKVGVSKRDLLESKLKETFFYEALISVVYNTGRDCVFSFSNAFNADDKYYTIEYDYTLKGGKGPLIEFFCTSEYARYSTREVEGAGNTEEIPAVKPNIEPVNEGILTTLAQAQAARIMNQFKDRQVGIVQVAGLWDMILIGNMSSITYAFDNSGLSTTLDMREIPFDPEIMQQIDQKSINFLKRHVSKGDEIAESGGKN